MCLVLAAGWGHAQETLFPDTWFSKAIESNYLDVEPTARLAPELQLPKSLMAGGSDEEMLRSTLAAYNLQVSQPTVPQLTVPQAPESAVASSGAETTDDAERFRGNFSNDSRRYDVGTDFYSPPEFEGGLIVFGKDVAMKIGGYVKADFIYDFDPIDSTDSFNTTDIPVGAPPRKNTRFHARQTRMSFDTRWASDEKVVRIFVEGDFFGGANEDGQSDSDDTFRLRHAYGEVGSLLVGQTWTTFTDIAAAPATLDFEGSVSTVKRRQAQIRWTHQVLREDLTMALAAENPQFIIDVPPGVTGNALTPSPDVVARLRLDRELVQFQVAYLYRLGGFQPTGGKALTSPASGFNFSGVFLSKRDTSKLYYQILFGNGIGSYRGLPDAVPDSATSEKILGTTAWMVGYTRDWTKQLSSNFTYAENNLSNSAFEPADDVHRTTYLAANLIWNPETRMRVGIEYLNGLRENVDRQVAAANRIQVAFIFDLP